MAYASFTLYTSPLLRTDVRLHLLFKPFGPFGQDELRLASVTLDPPETSSHLRYDALVAMVGLVLALPLGVLAASPRTMRLNQGSLGKSDRSGSADALGDRVLSSIDSLNVSEVRQPGEGPSLADWLASETAAARSDARDLYLRSNLLLAAGMIMAFVGVSVFYFVMSASEHALTGPSASQAQPTLEKYVPLFRSLTMLVFLEGISWFLLRQYRALIEDYKAFYRVYLKRSNYLLAFKALFGLPSEGNDAHKLTLAVSALQEDPFSTLRSAAASADTPSQGAVASLLNSAVENSATTLKSAARVPKRPAVPSPRKSSPSADGRTESS